MKHECTRCGTTLGADARFCEHCGNPTSKTKVDWETQTALEFPRSISVATGQYKEGPAKSTGQETPFSDGQLISTQVIGIVDRSISTNELCDSERTKLGAIKQGFYRFARARAHTEPQCQIALISFSSDASLDVPMVPVSSGLSRLEAAIGTWTPSGMTKSKKAFELAENTFDWNAEKCKYELLFLTDGEDNGDDPMPVVSRLKKSRGVTIDTIGFAATRNEVNEDLLRRIASVDETGVRYRFIADRQTLLAHYTSLGTVVGD